MEDSQPNGNSKRESVLPSREPKAVAERRMERAAHFAVFMGMLRLLAGIIGLASYRPSEEQFYIAAGVMLDAAILFGLAFGLYRRSRVGAILFLVYILFLHLPMIFMVPPAGSGLTVIILAIAGAVYAARAAIASFRYHKLVKGQAQTS